MPRKLLHGLAGRGIVSPMLAVTAAHLLAVTAAYAQQPSEAQTAAIRQSCRSDFMSDCAGVQPGGRDALQCLQRNVAKLSPACKTAVSATLPAPSQPAAAAPTPPAASAPPAMTPSASAPPPAAATSAPPAAAAASAPPAHPSAKAPSQAQMDAIRQSCRSDFMADCAGVQPGGRDALHCLQRNAARLSPPCKAAVAASMPTPTADAHPANASEAAPPPPAAMAPAAAPAVAPLKVRPFIMPQRRLVIVTICSGDVGRWCQGVPPGGERVLECLAAHAASLSQECYAAVARVSER